MVYNRIKRRKYLLAQNLCIDDTIQLKNKMKNQVFLHLMLRFTSRWLFLYVIYAVWRSWLLKYLKKNNEPMSRISLKYLCDSCRGSLKFVIRYGLYIKTE